MAQYIKDNKAPQLIVELSKVARIYTCAGFRLAILYADMEFKSIKSHINNVLKANLNCTSADKHVLEAENSNKVI